MKVSTVAISRTRHSLVNGGYHRACVAPERSPGSMLAAPTETSLSGVDVPNHCALRKRA